MVLSVSVPTFSRAIGFTVGCCSTKYWDLSGGFILCPDTLVIVDLHYKYGHQAQWLIQQVEPRSRDLHHPSPPKIDLPEKAEDPALIQVADIQPHTSDR